MCACPQEAETKKKREEDQKLEDHIAIEMTDPKEKTDEQKRKEQAEKVQFVADFIRKFLSCLFISSFAHRAEQCSVL